MIISPLAFIFAVGTVSCTVPASTTVILPTAIPDESKPNFDPFSPDGRFTGIDGPNVQPINETVFDWWYFDVVALPDSEDSSNQNTPAEARSDGPLASMVITLFASTNKAFPFLPPTSDEENVLTAYIWLTFPNGTWASKYIHADQATIVTSGAGGSSGKFDSTGFSWSSAEDMSKYTIKVDAEDTLGMKGVIEMETASRFFFRLILPFYSWNANYIPDHASTHPLRRLRPSPERGAKQASTHGSGSRTWLVKPNPGRHRNR